MNDNKSFQPGDETFDDVAGHGLRSGRLVADEDDTEGHGFRGNAVADGDDTEGHGVRIKFALPAEDGEDGDDTEGHGIRIKI